MYYFFFLKKKVPAAVLAMDNHVWPPPGSSRLDVAVEPCRWRLCNKRKNQNFCCCCPLINALCPTPLDPTVRLPGGGAVASGVGKFSFFFLYKNNKSKSSL